MEWAHDRAGVRGVRALRASLARLARDGRTDSRLERRVRRWLAAHGFEPEPGTYRVTLDSGRIVEFDIVFLPERLAIEVDGVRWHGSPGSQHADLWRDREAADSGWDVLRVSERDLDERGGELAAHLWRRLAARRQLLGLG